MFCSVEGCKSGYYAKSFCCKHYYRNKRHGSPLFQEAFKKDEKCTVSDCENHQRSKGLCEKHYAKMLRTETLEYKRLHDGKATERNRTRTSNWKKENKDYYLAYLLNRKRRVRQATPKWVDKKELIDIYKNCPKGFHVDHIVPLYGETVSGLHVSYNLQYLPAKENLKKGNKFDRSIYNKL